MNVTQILSYGVIGLGFLLGLLSYRLLNKERREKSPREIIITAIYAFMLFSVVLCIIGFASEVYRNSSKQTSIQQDNDLDTPTSGIDSEIMSGRKFYVAFNIRNRFEQDCTKREQDSPLGDFLVGAVYEISYDKSSNLFNTRGLNHGVAGCPWQENPDAREGNDLSRRLIRLWGDYFKYDEKGRVYHIGSDLSKGAGGRYVGHIFFNPE